MIGRSLVIFQLGNNRNEIHSVDPWSFCLGSHMMKDEDFEKKIIREAKKKKWKSEAVVRDADVKAIVYARSCIKGRRGYHKWASDGVYVINRSGDPNLYNPAKELAQKRRAKQIKREEALERLKGFLPELVKLRNAVPVRTIKLNLVVPITLKIDYGVSEEYFNIDVLGENGKEVEYTSAIVSRDKIRAMPEMSDFVNCPHRKAYHQRCREIAKLLKHISTTDVENHTYTATKKP